MSATFVIMSADIKDYNTSENIDLLLLIERAILFFKKYKWVFLIAIVLGIALGLFTYRSLPRIYKSRLVLHSNILTNEEEIQIINNWNELLKKKEYNILAATLHCREEIFYSIQQMKAEEIQKVFSPTNPNGFFIDVNVKENNILDELQAGIINGLENVGYVKERLAFKRADLKNLIEKSTQEIKNLDSTKYIIENIIRGKGKSSSSLIVDGFTINKQLLDMNEKLLSYKTELKFTNAVQILQSFSKFKKPVGARLIVWLILGLLVSLSLAYIYALISSVNERLRYRKRVLNNV